MKSYFRIFSGLLAAVTSISLCSLAAYAETFTVSDITCTGNHDCVSSAGCQSLRIEAQHTGWYKFIVHTECDEGDCTDYQACANIVDESGNNKNCHTANCNLGDCQYICNSGNGRACLIEGHEYTLYICLIGCGGGSCPPSTGNNCKAVFELSYAYDSAGCP